MDTIELQCMEMFWADRELVLPDRIELSTSPLPRECSTTELRQQTRGTVMGPAPKRRRVVPQGTLWRQGARMNGPAPGLTPLRAARFNQTHKPGAPACPPNPERCFSTCSA